MNINTISYLVADAFHTMKKDLKNELISLGTMIATMVLIATAYIVYANANIIINDNKDKSSNIMAYLETGLSDKKMQEILKPFLYYSYIPYPSFRQNSTY